VKQVAPHDRPREKLARAGVSALGDNELVALLVGSGIRGRSALAVAQEVLDRTGGVHGLLHVGLDELRRVGGVGAPRAARLLAAIELGRRAMVSGKDRPQFLTPADLGDYLLALFGGFRVERFGVALLDSKNRLIRTVIVSVGSLDSSIADPREIFREAAIATAASVVLFHNHPSGDPNPSDDDVALTERLVQAGTVMGIEVADHIILGDGTWFSFRTAGHL
jgi:DNA repair protein RadC